MMEIGGTYSATLKQFQDNVQIRSQARQPGCYVLLSPDAALYAGSSTLSMTDRIRAHSTGKGTRYLYQRLARGKRCGEHLTITLYPTKPEEARRKEVEIIGELDPLYNSRQPNTGRY